ncbi:hypothetical protein VQ042_05630 [Aurantimonas sp. A2-1-M11]|uniref:hypothetical protein n=1 Tax=Aurantimonas sp. A2-1-M11 TaxID=3113712 RepID=UPI002F93381C
MMDRILPNRRRMHSGLTACALVLSTVMSNAVAAEGDGATTPASVADRVRKAAEDAIRSEAGTDGGAEAGTPVVAPETGEDEAGGEHAAVETHAADGTELWPRERAPMPYEIVRSLQFLQDQVARGNGAAIRVQAQLLRRYGPTFLAQPSEVWTDPRNLRAAALFVLSGGPPSVLRGILASATIEGEDRALLDGALAYVENRSDDARRMLEPIDVAEIDTALAAQLNLAMAQLLQTDAPSEALHRLEQVMLAAPGTLLEEAALRMGVLLAENTGAHAAADRYARQYFDRFSESAYAGNFRARFSAVYAARPPEMKDDTVATISDATAHIPADQRLAIFLAVARRALVGGNLQLAATMASEALDFGTADPADSQRALLYQTAATLTTRDSVQARVALEAIDVATLHPADRKLHEAAFEVLSEMRKPLMAANVELADRYGPQPPVEQSAVLTRGAALLDAVRGDLKRATP